ncbi:MAG: hypothetical protein R8G66_23845 [Cytophagales bacterium]|nr:hypothetical protein [Cytophagales bacterium]
MEDLTEKINLDFLHSHDLGTAFVKNMLGIYEGDIRDRLEIFADNSVSALEREEIVRHVHTLGSHTRDLGFQTVHNRLVAIEDQVVHMDEEVLERELTAIITLLQKVLEQITEELQKLS